MGCCLLNLKETKDSQFPPILKSTLIKGLTHHGEKIHHFITPNNETDLHSAKNHHTSPLVVISGSNYVKLTTTSNFNQCLSEREAVSRFLFFLERSKSRVRPAYDGIILVSHSSDHLAQFIKTFTKYKLYDRLVQSVAGVADLSKFIGHNKLKSNKSRNYDLNQPQALALAEDYESVFCKKLYLRNPMCDDVARICQVSKYRTVHNSATI